MLTIETDRLRLRPLADDDAAFVVELLNDPSWIRYIGDRGVRTDEDARAYIANGPAAMYARHGFGLLVVERREDGEPVGMCGLLKRDSLEDVDIGYALLPKFWGKGYAVEAAAAVLESARVAGIPRVVAITTPDNEASGRVLERIGFRFEGTVRLSEDAEELRLYGVDLAGEPPTKR